MTIESCRETDEGSFDGFRLYVNDRSVSRIGHFPYRIPSAALAEVQKSNSRLARALPSDSGRHPIEHPIGGVRSEAPIRGIARLPPFMFNSCQTC